MCRLQIGLERGHDRQTHCCATAGRRHGRPRSRSPCAPAVLWCDIDVSQASSPVSTLVSPTLQHQPSATVTACSAVPFLLTDLRWGYTTLFSQSLLILAVVTVKRKRNNTPPPPLRTPTVVKHVNTCKNMATHVIQCKQTWTTYGSPQLFAQLSAVRHPFGRKWAWSKLWSSRRR